MTRRDPPLAGSLFVAAWAVVDAWLIYGVVQHVLWRIG